MEKSYKWILEVEVEAEDEIEARRKLGAKVPWLCSNIAKELAPLAYGRLEMKVEAETDQEASGGE